MFPDGKSFRLGLSAKWFLFGPLFVSRSPMSGRRSGFAAFISSNQIARRGGWSVRVKHDEDVGSLFETVYVNVMRGIYSSYYLLVGFTPAITS